MQGKGRKGKRGEEGTGGGMKRKGGKEFYNGGVIWGGKEGDANGRSEGGTEGGGRKGERGVEVVRNIGGRHALKVHS